MKREDITPETSLYAVFDHLFSPVYLRGRAEQTRVNYRSTLNLLAEFLARIPVLADLNDVAISQFLDWYFSRDNVKSARSANNRRDYLCCLWRWCARKRIVNEFPDIEKLPEPEILPDSWTDEELAALFKASEQEDKQIGRQPGQLYWTVLHLFLMDAGERCGALLAIEWTHYNPTTGVVTVPGSIRKGGKKGMVYHLREETRRGLDLMRLIDPAGRSIFGDTGMTLNTFYKRYDRIIVRAGLQPNRRHKLQKMRRTFATYVEREGGDATDALRHEDRRTTLASYIDRRIVPQRLYHAPLPAAVVQQLQQPAQAPEFPEALPLDDETPLILPDERKAG